VTFASDASAVNDAGVADVTLAPDTDGADGADASATCPAPAGAGRMVRVDVVRDGGAYCIDAFEVTNAEFNVFLQTADSLTPLPSRLAPPVCASPGVGRRPDVEADPAKANRPAEAMGWCFAYAYCAWVGKRLCGKIGGSESVARNSGEIDLQNQWDYACASGAIGSAYPYGALYDASTCNTETHVLADVDANPTCHGQGAPFDRIFDMSGNVAEFDDSVDYNRAEPAADPRGGGAEGTASGARCSSGSAFGVYEGFQGVGFRCCADLAR